MIKHKEFNKTLGSQDMQALPQIFSLFWISKQIFTWINAPPKYTFKANFPTQKNPGIENFKLKRLFRLSPVTWNPEYPSPHPRAMLLISCTKMSNNLQANNSKLHRTGHLLWVNNHHRKQLHSTLSNICSLCYVTRIIVLSLTTQLITCNNLQQFLCKEYKIHKV